MYTSDTDKNTPRAPESRKAADRKRSRAAGSIAFRYTAAAAAVAVIGLVYELFSHGVWSPFMGFGFMVPLVLGALPNLFIWLTGAKEPGPAAENVYACGVVTLTAGCLLKGVLEIFGTTNHLIKIYPVAGVLLTVAGAILYLTGKKKAEV